jgi:hypothetical protein
VALKNSHKAWLQFVRRATDVPLGYSKEELLAFRNLAKRNEPAYLSIVEAFIDLAERSEINASPPQERSRRNVAAPHLFDLLREKKFFPKNLDLAHFASRVLPHLKTHRFDKMSRGDIASRIIEHIENNESRAREQLEESMRDALNAMKHRPAKPDERQSFLSKWEKIIKGVEL